MARFMVCLPEKLLRAFRTFSHVIQVIVQVSINHSLKPGTAIATNTGGTRQRSSLAYS